MMCPVIAPRLATGTGLKTGMGAPAGMAATGGGPQGVR